MKAENLAPEWIRKSRGKAVRLRMENGKLSPVVVVAVIERRGKVSSVRCVDAAGVVYDAAPENLFGALPTDRRKLIEALANR